MIRFLPSAVFGIALFSSLEVGAITRVSLTPVAEGFTSPTAYVPLTDRSALIVDQVGQIRRIDPTGQLDATPVFDATDRMIKLNQGSFDERGLLDLALHPEFSKNRKVYVAYSAPLRPGGPIGFDNTLRISEFVMPESTPLRIDPSTERILIAVDKPYFNHNGGRLAFGPDGYLYIGFGDGGNANDVGKRPLTGNGQNLDTLMGKIVRMDVNAPDGRGIPKDNPFADGKHGRPEIYAYGFRNPWGLSFDRGGDRALYACDVGQTMFEEVNRVVSGGNYGWFLKEGFIAFDPNKPTKPPETIPTKGARGESLIDPIAAYKNLNGWKKDPEAYGISVTGGYIYRGKAIPELEGHYVYGDWSRGWAMPQGQLLVATRPSSGDAPWKVEPVEISTPEKFTAYIVAFGQDAEGEIYVMTNGSNSLKPGTGKVWKLGPPQR